ncbi:MAG: IclR family transcriptional regulator [Lachnospiraceae bacterium]|nr:IclR family transcriptional regulator [Lachnospiraceae bacterium]
MAKEQVSSISRMIRILECFMDQSREWTLKEIAGEVGLPSTTVFRHLSTLTAEEYLVQDPLRKSYQIGPRFIILAGAIWSQYDLRQIAKPELEKLCSEVEETINLTLLMEHDVFYLDKVDAVRSIVCSTHIGQRLPAYAAGCGKLLISQQSDEYIEEYLAWMSTHAKKFTENTITDPDAMREALSEIRRSGIGIDLEESELGLCCVSAPIYDSRHCVAAISIAGPNFRMRERWEDMKAAARKTADNVSRILGYR